ncbi:MAG: sigma-70 family RNA polymerase sigma factor [Planctomycetaceae bacterium]|nr:sigma-70 family RNA polymerase sigma factor [Planctomycetaceae bacterium]
MHSEYRNPILKQLRDQQVRYAPRDKKLEQVSNAEALLHEVSADKTYPYEFLCYRITGYRPESSPHLTVAGEELGHDLRLFIEDVSDAADVNVQEVGQPVYTVEDLSKMFNVSTKTISRWRQQGLVSRRFLFSGRKRVGFLQQSVDRFVTNNRERVKRGERFSQLTSQERGEIVQRARRLARAGGTPSEVTRRIAKQMNRSIETIRYTLKHFDSKHPELAIFPDRTGPLTVEAKETIYRQYRRGTTVDELAKRHCRTKTSIYRVINEMRAERIMELPLDYIGNECFEQRNAEKVILSPMPVSDKKTRAARAPSGLPPYLASLYDVPLLNREQEGHLFRKLNFLKFKAAGLRDSIDLVNAKSTVMDEIERLYDQAVEVKNQIVQANLRLVVSIAKRHVTQSEEFFGLVSDGNMSLIRAAEKFDYARGNKFSTYASWAIMKNFARTIPQEFKQRDRFRTSSDEMFVSTEDFRKGLYEQESAQQLRENQVDQILSSLDDREQKIIISRFGLDHKNEPQTLKEVGAQMGVTKERIRQIEARALTKLRLAAQEEKIEIPD